MAKETRKNACGSFHGHTITATPQQLIDLFPNSYYESNDGRDKTNFDFTLETNEGDVFTVYDWKYYRSLKMNEKVEWNIGAEDKNISAVARGELLAMLR